MLRLRPSEITLTSADIEESRRRIPRQLAVLHSTTQSTRAPRPRARPSPGPRVRCGPEHSRDDSITCLGNIPVLRPHQVVHDSADGDPGHDEAVSPSLQGESSINNVPAERTATPPRNTAAEPSTGHRMQLPFRLAPVDSTVREKTEEDEPSLPTNHTYGHSEFGRQKTNTSEETTEGPAQSRLPFSADGLAEAFSTSLVFGRGQSRSVYSHNSQETSPPAVSSPCQPQRERGSHTPIDTPMQAPTTMYLQGYFASPEEYTFKEYPIMPRTEPRQRAERPSQMIRTISSSSDPSLSALAQRADRSFTTDDVFWTPPPTIIAQREASDSVNGSGSHRRRPSLEERIPYGSHHISQLVHDRYRGLFGRGRTAQAQSTRLDVDGRASQRLSEASSTSSLPYSFYELPVSRQPSDTHPQGGQLPQSQYDGAAPSREVSRGGYFSTRPSQVPLRPPPVRLSSFSSPNLVIPLGQHRMSPSPASPYSQGPRASPRHHYQVSSADNTAQHGPSMGLITSRDFVGGDQNATSAVQRDLSSPLELLEQRASSHLSRVSTALHTASPSSQRSSEGPSVFRYQVADFDEQQQHRRSWRASGGDGFRQSSGRGIRSRTTTATSRRYPAATRAAQRSSENVPVGAQTTVGSIQNAPSSHRGDLRGGDMPSSPNPLQFNVPQASTPRDVSNRSQLQPLHQPGRSVRSPRQSDRTTSPPELSNIAQLQDVYRHTQDLEREHNAPYSSSPASPFQSRRQVSQRYEQTPLLRHQATILPEDIPRRESSRRYPAGPRMYLERPERISLAPSLGQGAGRRPVVTRAPTSRRRITSQQQNQENSGEAENERMREEILAAGMRYADEGQQDVMDETPPRLGRFERAALG